MNKSANLSVYRTASLVLFMVDRLTKSPDQGKWQKDVGHLFGSSGRASEAINGLRPISKIQAKALAEFFNVSTDLFLGV